MQLLPLVLALVLAQCTGAADSEPTALSRQAILSGQTVTSPDSPVLYLSGPEGACTAVLVAPNLIVTARHCTAQTVEGSFTCTAEGDLVATGSAGGQIGANDSPSSLRFFTDQQIIAGTEFSNPPDAVGMTTISTNTPTVCRDDLAFVVLDRPIAGIAPATMRLDTGTSVGEAVSAWGYGLTDSAGDPVALRTRSDGTIVGVGPHSPSSTVQLAPLRAVRLGAADITCIGDSGGPMISIATGAIVAIVSLGNQSSLTSPTCTNTGGADTTGPRLAEYKALALAAFAAAGATPPFDTVDAGAEPVAEAGSEQTDEAGPTGLPDGEPTEITVKGASCSTAFGGRTRGTLFGGLAMTLAMTAAAVGRRRR